MLTRAEVISVYNQVLGHPPSEEEIAHHLERLDSLDQMLRVALDSEEYALVLRARTARSALAQNYASFFHPDLANWTRPEGTRSVDGAAIVGREGWLFLYGGSNANLEQYLGEVAMEPGWLERWRQAIAHRRRKARELGIELVVLVVPDKLAIYEQHYPEDLQRVGPRPIERLLTETELPILYPADRLRAAAAAGEEVYLRTDSHLSFRGNELLAAATLERLGAGSPELTGVDVRTSAVAGDLGVKFEPQIVGLRTDVGSLGKARIVEDNRARIEALNGHLGTRRVFANEAAPDPRVAVVFGDSFGFATHRYQGVAWFLAQAFGEVHFVWIPFGWDSGYLRRVGAEVALVEGAERFLARVPLPEVDVDGLAEETLRRKRALDVDQVFE